jgi:hypothetical protein
VGIEPPRSSRRIRTTAELNTRLEKVAASWPDRAQVRSCELPSVAFDPSKDDFLEELLPFVGLPSYAGLSAADRQRVLTCGWLIYSHKTMVIELDIITPACSDMLRTGVPGTLRWNSAPVIAQTIVDEGYHTLLAVNVCRLSALHRGIDLDTPTFRLATSLGEQMDSLDAVGGRVARLAFAAVSELFISDHLRLLSQAHAIQPIHRASVEAHERDERTHRAIFPTLLQDIIQSLDQARRGVFIDAAFRAVDVFADYEYPAWATALGRLGIATSDRMIAEARARPTKGIMHLDLSALEGAFEELGLGADARVEDRLEKMLAEPHRARMTREPSKEA